MSGAPPGTIHTWAHGEQAQKQPDGTWKVRLYRAAARPEVNSAGTTSFSPDRTVAEAYLDGANPGFGGANLYKVEPDVDPKKVLDVREGLPRWLEEIAEGHGGGASNSWVLTASDKARQAMLDRGYQWVRFTDDYPTGAETWALLDDEHGEDEVEPKMRKLKKSLCKSREGLGPHGYPPGTVHEWDGVKMRKEAGGKWKPLAGQQQLDLGEAGHPQPKLRRPAVRSEKHSPTGTQLDLLSDRPARLVQEQDRARGRSEQAVKERAELQAKLERAEALGRAAEDWKANGIRARAFKSWFGDWESADPKVLSKISKVRDKVTGEPKLTWQLHLGGRKAAINVAKKQGASVVVGPEGPVTAYHGTSHGGFTEFDPKKTAKNSLFGPGFYFTEDRAVAESYQKKGQPRKVTDLEGANVDSVQAFLDEVAPWTGSGLAYDLKNEKHWAERASILDHVYKHQDIAEKHGIKIPKHQVYSVYLNIRNPYDVDHTKIDVGDLPPSESGKGRALSIVAVAADKPEVGAAIRQKDRKAAWEAGVAAIPGLPDKDLHNMLHALPAAAGMQGPDVAVYAKGMAKNHRHTDPEMQGTYKYFRENPNVLLASIAKAFSLSESTSNPYGDVSYHQLVKYAGDEPGATSDKSATTALLKQLGYDGITHIGGKATNQKIKHRVWIAFEPTQIKAAEGNQGTFDPKDADMTKSNEPVEKSLLLGASMAAAHSATRGQGSSMLSAPIPKTPAQRAGQYQGGSFWDPQKGGREGLQLVPSKENPNIKRWQKVGAVDKVKRAFGGGPKPAATLQEHLGQYHDQLQSWAQQHGGGADLQTAAAVQAGTQPPVKMGGWREATEAFGKLNDEQHHALHEAHQWYTGRMGKSLTGDEMETYSPFEDLCKSLDVDPVPTPEELLKGEPSQPPPPGPAGPPPPVPRPGAPAPTPPGSTPAPSAPSAAPPKPVAPPGPPMPQGPDKGPDEDNEDAPGPGKYPPLMRSATETLDAGVLARSLSCETGERLAKLIEKGGADCPYDHREQFDTSWLKQQKKG